MTPLLPRQSPRAEHGRQGQLLVQRGGRVLLHGLQKERIGKRICKNREPAIADASGYIDTLQNRTRRHSHPGGVSPDQFAAGSQGQAARCPMNHGNSRAQPQRARHAHPDHRLRPHCRRLGRFRWRAVGRSRVRVHEAPSRTSPSTTLDAARSTARRALPCTGWAMRSSCGPLAAARRSKRKSPKASVVALATSAPRGAARRWHPRRIPLQPAIRTTLPPMKTGRTATGCGTRPAVGCPARGSSTRSSSSAARAAIAASSTFTASIACVGQTGTQRGVFAPASSRCASKNQVCGSCSLLVPDDRRRTGRRRPGRAGPWPSPDR